MPTTTPFMSLTLPDVGAGGTVGTTWATYLNTALSAIDSHDHTSGSGNQIPSAGLDIDADLDFSDFGADNLGFVAFTARALKPTPTLSLYAKGADLYFQDSTGTEVRITQDSALAGSSDGGFGGDYGDGDELATYSNATKTFSFMQDTSPAVPAKIYSSDISIGQATTAPNVITLKSPNSLAASYTLTLPTALPASTRKLQFSSSGVGSFDTTINDFAVYDGEAGSGASQTITTSWATLAFSSTKIAGQTISRATNTISFSVLGTYKLQVELINFREVSNGADLMVRIRNTATATTEDASAAYTIGQTDVTMLKIVSNLYVTVTNVAHTFEVQAVSSNAVAIQNVVGSLDGENSGPVYRLTITTMGV